MNEDLKTLRHPKERTYGMLVMVFGCLVWAIVAALLTVSILMKDSLVQALILLLEFGFFALFIYLVNLFHRAYLFGHAVLITERQFPHLYESLKRGAAKLGLPSVPQSFLYNSNGLMNAFAARMAGHSMVLLTSALIDVDQDQQVDFVIGHELGHHAAGHLSPWKNFLKLPGSFVPFLGAAYHRSRELTADRIGAYCVDDVEAARGGLFMLACGSARLNALMNANAFAEQEQLVPPIAGFLLHVFSGYPRTTRRVVEVETYFRDRGYMQPATMPSYRPASA